jgi:hypothetical protein
VHKILQDGKDRTKSFGEKRMPMTSSLIPHEIEHDFSEKKE